MTEALQNILAAIGAVFAVGGGIAAIAYALLKLFSEKWLSAKFEERLAAYKHAQQKEIEELRFKISALMDRTIKLHQKEFDVLPEAWSKLSDAHGVVTAITSALQQYPDLDRMSDPHFEEFLKDSPLADWQKDEIRSTEKRTNYYMKAIAWHKIAKGRDACREFHLYLKKNGIFIPESMKAKFVDIDKLIYGALVEYEINVQDSPQPMLRENIRKLPKESEPLMAALEKLIQDRLWDSKQSL